MGGGSLGPCAAAGEPRRAGRVGVSWGLGGLLQWPVARSSGGGRGEAGGPDMTRIAIYDTTLRDGSQGEGVNFSLQDKLLITRRLDELGVDYVEGGYPLSNPKDSEYFQQVRKLRLRHAKVVAFGMTCRKGVEAARD